MSSLTALALLPGVLKTAVPLAVACLIGTLLIPAPARTITLSDVGNYSS